jgi:acetyl esterase/lipase
VPQATKPGSDSLPVTADLSRCFLGGDSAGGNITHHVGCQAAKTDLGPITIRGLIMLQPFFGGEEKTKSEVSVTNPVLLTNFLSDWFWRAFLPPGANKDHGSCNVFGPNAPDISDLPLPSIFLAIGTHDILKDRQVQYAKNMALIFGPDNITVKKYIMGFHGFFAFDLLLQKALMTDISAFVKGVLAKLPQD